jgi:hypothetical protein
MAGKMMENDGKMMGKTGNMMVILCSTNVANWKILMFER